MLPKYYRIIVFNSSGQTVAYDSNGRLNLKITGWYIDPTTGKMSYTDLSDDDFSFGSGDSVADGNEEKTSEIDNSSTLYLGLIIKLEVTHDEGTAADGSFDLFIDGGAVSGELSSDASGYLTAWNNMLTPIGALRWEPNGLDDEIMRSASIFV